MDFINDFLRSQADEGRGYYSLVGSFGLYLMIAVVVFYLVLHLVRVWPKYLDTIKGFFIAVIAYLFTGYAQQFVVWYRDGFDLAKYGSQPANWALGFVLLPVLVCLLAKVFNTPFGFAGDVATVALLGNHVFGRVGCLFPGCCYGFPCDWGWYSHAASDNAVHNAINNNLSLPEADFAYYQFPTALVEGLFTLAILVFVLIRICRKGYVPDGKTMPYFLLLYGVCRFVSETTRESTKDIWFLWRFSDIHVIMLIMAVTGFFMLSYIHKKEKEAALPAEEALPELKGQRR